MRLRGQRTEDRGQETGDRRQETGKTLPSLPFLSLVSCLLSPVRRLSPVFLVFAVVVLVALPIFAHGCHRGDHDDEPLVAPLDHHAVSLESPQ
jgi:hypothetical protein